MTNKIKKILGLSYKANKLPAIVFKGNGIYADYYEKEFKKNKPSYRIVQNEALLDKLSQLPVESEISPDLYELVAILLVHVYSLEIKVKKDKRGESNGSD
jgi:type III secretion system FlhB-like substrate exporter